MPLHDWTDLPGWDGVHQLWLVELLHWIKPRLPDGYRTYIGTSPTFAIDVPVEDRPDVGVRRWSPPMENLAESTPETAGEDPAWGQEVEMAVATLALDHNLIIERQGILVAVVELVSPRNKDRTSSQRTYSDVYTGYLRKGIHLLLIDVHRRPTAFSFFDRIAHELQFPHSPTPAPFAVTYRVGEPSPNGGRFLAVGRRPLTAGEAMPVLPLALTVHQSVPVDLEQTYARAAEAAYLS